MSSHSQTFKGGNGSTAGKPAVATMEVISKSNNKNSKKSTTTSTSQHSTTSTTSSSSSASSSSSSSTTSSTSKDPLKTRCSGLTQITRKTMVTSERLGRLSMALPLTPTPTPPELEDHHQQQEEEGEGEGNESSRKLVLLPGGKWAAIQATSDTISRLKMPPGTALVAGGVTKSISCNAEWCIAAPCSSSDELNHKGCIGGRGGGGSTAGSSASKPPTMQLSNSSASLLKASKTKATTYLQLYCHNYSHNHSHNGGSCAGGGGGSASASASGSGKGGGASFSSAHFNLSSGGGGGGGGPHDEPEREHWDKKIEFLLAVIGFAVDLGNVWRFPYVCYRNGGGAFLVAYCIMLLFGGLPLFFLELALGQYFSSGCLTIWKRLCPVMKGLGYAICMIDIYMGMYYNTIISWSLYYLYVSCQSLVNFSLPWDDCSHAWNTDRCQTLEQRGTSAGAALLNNRTNNGNSTATGNVTAAAAAAAAAAAVELSSVSPAEEYFLNHVLQINTSSGIDSLGPIRSSLAVCLMLIFLVVYFSLWKGVKSTGKVVWVTALMPYFVIFVFLIRATTLEGAIDGIRFYLEPDWSKLKSINVWIDAATQIFFSLGPGFGTLMALSSYNKFHNNCYRDAILTSSINCLTSFIAGFVTFSILGFMSKKLNKDISTVVADGPGLVFVVYPEAISTMYGSVFFSILFFVMLITLGLDSTFGGLEAMITGLCDNYPHLLRRNREVFVAVLIVIIYLCALPTTTHGGNYLINLLDQHGTAMPVLFVVFAETIAICWFYGSEKFSHQIKEMLGSKPGIFWRICWRVISPLFLGFICIASLLELKPLKMGEYSYPQWSLALGWMITFSSLSCIPIYAVYHFCHTPGDSFEDRLRKCFRPVAMVSAGGGVRGGGISSAAAAAAASSSAMMDNCEESCPLKGETSPSAAEMGNCTTTSAAAAQHNLTTGESVGEPV